MPEQPIAEFQKIRLAVDKGRNGEALPATRGHFSETFFKSMTAALKLAAPLVEHLVAMMTVEGGSDDRVDGSREAPLPMNTNAFNDTNEIYSRLVYFANLFAGDLHRQAPGPAKRAWADRTGKIIGLPVDLSPGQARYAVGIMATWLTVNLEDILGTNDIDAITYFRDELGMDLFRLNAAWPRVEKPRWSQMPCPNDECKGKIAIYPPAEFGEDERIICTGMCGRHFPVTDYEFLIRLFTQINEEEKTGKKVNNHLIAKYAPTQEIA